MDEAIPQVENLGAARIAQARTREGKGREMVLDEEEAEAEAEEAHTGLHLTI